MSDRKLYRPSNGTEGECFVSDFCYNCIHEKFTHTQNHADKKCEIFSASLIFNTHEEGYPKEWAYDDNNKPTCTSFVKWDWGNDEDGWNEPPPPEPYDPNQLVMPFIVEEVEQNTIQEKEKEFA